MALIVELQLPPGLEGGPADGRLRHLAVSARRRRGVGQRVEVEVRLAAGGFDGGRLGSTAALVAAARAAGRAVTLGLAHSAEDASAAERLLDLSLPLTAIPLAGEDPVVVELDTDGRLLALVTAWRRDWLVPARMVHSASTLGELLDAFGDAVTVHPGLEAILDTVLSPGPDGAPRPVALLQEGSRVDFLRRLLGSIGRDLGLGPLLLGGGLDVGRDWWLVPADPSLVASAMGGVPAHPGGKTEWRSLRRLGPADRPVVGVEERSTGPWNAEAWEAAMSSEPPWSADQGAWVHAVEDELRPSGPALRWSRTLGLLPRGARLPAGAGAEPLGPATVVATVGEGEGEADRCTPWVELDAVPVPAALSDELCDVSYEIDDEGEERRGAPPAGRGWSALLVAASSGAQGTTGLHLAPSPGTRVVVAFSGRVVEPAMVLGNLREQPATVAAPSCRLEDELLLHLAPTRVLAAGPVTVEPSLQVHAEQDLELQVAGDLRSSVEGASHFEGSVATVEVEDYRLESSGGVALLADGDTNLGGRGSTHVAGDGELHLSGGQTAVALRGGNVHMG